MTKEYDSMDEIKKDMEKVVGEARKLNGNQIGISELMTPEFMQRYTEFGSFDEMLNASVVEYKKKIVKRLTKC